LVQKLTTPPLIHCIFVWQWLITFSITAVLFLIKRDLALSAFLGGLVCVVPSMYFARQIFTKRRIAAAHALLRSVYIAEFIKMGLAVALLTVVLINYKEVHPIILFVTYFITQSCMWAVPLITQQYKNQPSKKALKQAH